MAKGKAERKKNETGKPRDNVLTCDFDDELDRSAQDTAEKLDYNRQAKVVQAVHATILELSR